MTSGQYAYLIFQRFRRFLSCTNGYERIYFHNFAGEVLKDPGIKITGEIYQEFCDLFDEIAEDISKTYYLQYSVLIEHETFPAIYAKTQLMFSLLNINFYLTNPTSYYTYAAFDLPSGITVKTSMYLQNLRFNIFMQVTPEYLTQIYPYYFFTPKEDGPDLNKISLKKAGNKSYWNYDEEKQFLYINGEGPGSTWEDYSLWNYLGINSIKAIIIDAGVSRFCKNSLSPSSMVLVDYHAPDDIIVLDDGWCYYNSKDTWNSYYTIYTDNNILKNYNYDGATIYPLSEWKGEV